MTDARLGITVLGSTGSIGVITGKIVTGGTWVRTIIAVGPAHLKRVIDRAEALLHAPS